MSELEEEDGISFRIAATSKAICCASLGAVEVTQVVGEEEETVSTTETLGSVIVNASVFSSGNIFKQTHILCPLLLN